MRFLIPLLLAVALLPTAGSASAPVPELLLEPEPGHEATARQLRAMDPVKLAGIVDLVGLADPGEPIRVILASEASDSARAAPPWVSGYAYGSLGVIVLFPERTPSYPDSSLAELLRHEIAHVLIARAAGGRPVPRWFNEGLATLAADVWRLADRSRLTLSLVLTGETPIADLDQRFAGNRREVATAYALSSAFVRDLALRYRAGAPAEILELVAVGAPFEEAFLRATGRTLEQAERSFWRRYSIWYRWFPIISSSITGWTLITLLFLLATWRKRQRTEALRERWEEEERWLGELESGEPAVSERQIRPH